MKDIRVVQTEEGKFKVLVNYIQEGIAYSTKDQADKEAETVKKKYSA